MNRNQYFSLSKARVRARSQVIGAKVVAHLKVDMDQSIQPYYVTEARIRGAEQPDDAVALPVLERQRLVLGQVKVADKSNEIVAIPALLDLLAIEGAILTIDAMGCQRAIAQKIIDKKADYVLALKGNQGTLCEDVEVFVAEQKTRNFQDTKISRHETVDGDHGRAVGMPDVEHQAGAVEAQVQRDIP